MEDLAFARARDMILYFHSHDHDVSCRVMSQLRSETGVSLQIH